MFLAFYLGVVNMVLAFASFALLGGGAAAYALSLLGIVPLIFYARYRARRYVLARTRWRGIRLALDPGAWGYALRALGHWVAVILTLGVLWPRLVFGLEKYRTDRTRWGDARLHQGGDWGMLMPSFAHLLIGIAFSVLSIVIVGSGGPERFIYLLAVFVPWTVFGLFHWIADSGRRLAAAKTATVPGRGRGLGLTLRLRTGRIMRIYLLGGLLVFLGLTVVSGVLGAVIAVAAAILLPELDLTAPGGLPIWLTTAGALALYFAVFLMFGVLRHVFVTLPLWQHRAEVLEIRGDPSGVAQIARDPFSEAEGFAEALDVGAAI